MRAMMGIRCRRSADAALAAVALTAVVACAYVLPTAQAAPAEDLVTSLPGVEGNLATKMYSGYLDVSSEDHVHYVLMESESDPASDPLVLWLNGGPGASSLMGAMTELGPYIIASNTTVSYNPYAWTQSANVLFLESPTGVGFSYCEAMTSGHPCVHNDTSTAALNIGALFGFMDKFPEYFDRDFMIWGESYAGVFIPTLSDLVYENRDLLGLNFLGFAVGDPCTDEKYQHMGDKLHFNLKYAFDNGFLSARVYNYLAQWCIAIGEDGSGVPDTRATGCEAAWRLYALSTSNNAGQSVVPSKIPYDGFINAFVNFGPNDFRINQMLEAYMNAPELYEALHVGAFPGTTWDLFHKYMRYTKEYYACFHEEGVPPSRLPHFHSSMLPFYQKLAGKLRNIIVYNGDSDPDVQMRGTEAAVDAMGLKMVEGGDWRPWFFQPDAASIQVLEDKSPYWGPFLSYRSMDPQLGGYVKNFEKNLSFVTVHTAGHLAPRNRPQAVLHILQRGLGNHLLSPILNYTEISEGSDASFFGWGQEKGYLGRWVGAAQSAAFLDPSP